MERYSRIAVWIDRLVLAAATLIFTMIGLRFIADPVRAAAARGLTVGSALASTTARVGFGAFPLAFAIFAFWSLLSRRRLRAGVSLVATLVATAIVVRLFGTLADGAAPESIRLFIPETVILLLSISGLVLEAAPARQESKEVRA